MRNKVILNTRWSLHIEHLFVEYCLKSLCVDAHNWRLVSCRISTHDRLPLVVPVDKVQVILSCWVDTDRGVLGNYLFLGRVWLFVLSHPSFGLSSSLLLLYFLCKWVLRLHEHVFVIIRGCCLTLLMKRSVLSINSVCLLHWNNLHIFFLLLELNWFPASSVSKEVGSVCFSYTCYFRGRCTSSHRLCILARENIGERLSSPL